VPQVLAALVAGIAAARRVVHMQPHGSSSNGVWFAGTKVIVRVLAAQSDGRLGAWESEESLRNALPLHVHTREDEQAVLLEGTVAFLVGDRVHHLVAGDTLALPRDVPHAHVVTSQNARVLTIAMPGGFEQLFVDLGVPALPGTTPLPPDTAALAQAAAALGVQIVGPPPVLDARS
jgi:quercetin dioxygenase-like cupin family protein